MELDFRSTADWVPGMLWTTLPTGEADFFSRRWYDYTGLSTAEALQNGWLSATHPDDAARVTQALNQSISSGTSYNVQQRVRGADGKYRWFETSLEAQKDDFGRIVRWCGLQIDIESQKQAEQDLLANIFDFRRVIDSIPALVSIMTPTGETELLNQQVLDYFGKTSEELKAWAISDAVHPDDLPHVLENFAIAINTGGLYDVEHRCRRADGVYRWFQVKALPVRDKAGNIVRWYCLLADIDDRKRAETLQAELARVSRANSIGALTASIAHEVSQPLAGIIANAEAFLRMLANSPPRIEGALETARLIIRDGTRAAEIVSRLRLLFAKTDELIMAIDLNAAAREIIALASRELQTKKVLLEEHFDETIPPVLGDRVQVQQVILNLLLNATEAMEGIDERPRRIVVNTRMDGAARVLFCVQDNGVGIDLAVAENLFQPFATTKEGGMGIGLFVSRSIIEKHHGRLWCESNNATGATFQFTLQAAPIS